MLALIVIPVVSPDAVKFVTVSVSVAFTSMAPDSRSTVNIASASMAASTTAPDTVGVSFVPVIVTVAVCKTLPPLLSTTS